MCVAYEECLNNLNSWHILCITDGCGDVRVIMFRAHAVASLCVCAYICGRLSAKGCVLSIKVNGGKNLCFASECRAGGSVRQDEGGELFHSLHPGMQPQLSQRRLRLASHQQRTVEYTYIILKNTAGSSQGHPAN